MNVDILFFIKNVELWVIKKTLQQQFSGITDDKNHKGYFD